MNQNIMSFDSSSNLRELSLEEIETVNGGVPVPVILAAAAIATIMVGAFGAGYNAGLEAGKALWA